MRKIIALTFVSLAFASSAAHADCATGTTDKYGFKQFSCSQPDRSNDRGTTSGKTSDHKDNK